MVARARARAVARLGARVGATGGTGGARAEGSSGGRTELLQRNGARLTVRLDNRLRVHALLNVRLALAQELARQQHDRRRAVADLSVLRHRDLLRTHGGAASGGVCVIWWANGEDDVGMDGRRTCTRVWAAGCTICSSFISVAPSLEMVTEPFSSWISLSMPRGPSVVRTTSTTAWHALMLLISCALPCDVSVPSLSRMICGCIIEPAPGNPCICDRGSGARRGVSGGRCGTGLHVHMRGRDMATGLRCGEEARRWSVP